MLTHDTTVTHGNIYINGMSCFDHSTLVSSNLVTILSQFDFELQSNYFIYCIGKKIESVLDGILKPNMEFFIDNFEQTAIQKNIEEKKTN